MPYEHIRLIIPEGLRKLLTLGDVICNHRAYLHNWHEFYGRGYAKSDTIKDRYSLDICLENDADFSGSLSSEEGNILCAK